MDVRKIQSAIKQQNLDGWLFCDFHNRDAIAYRILGLDITKFSSRRWFYLVLAEGNPIKLVSKVEPTKLDSLPGEKVLYLSWVELQRELKKMVCGKRLAMQYSPEDAIPYVSTVDAGLVELVRSLGCEVVSSADLVQEFEAILDEEAFTSHIEAGKKIHKIKDEAFEYISQSLKKGGVITEYTVQRFILQRFLDEGLDCLGENPIVAVNGHASDPHFEPTEENSFIIKYGDKILIDLWAKLANKDSIFYDITWCAHAGDDPPEEYINIFEIVRRARDRAVEFIQERFARGEVCYGYQVDDACREVITAYGYGQFFTHRTGHSIGRQVHGNGVNIDNLETCDKRQIVPGILFSIEPGIYIPDKMGVRSEINVFISKSRKVIVTGEKQEKIILL